jgi:hypothetical protein
MIIGSYDYRIMVLGSSRILLSVSRSICWNNMKVAEGIVEMTKEKILPPGTTDGDELVTTKSVLEENW